MMGIPTRPPRVPTVDIAAYNLPVNARSTVEARKDRRVMLAPDPRMVIVKPAMRNPRLGAKAMPNDPIDTRNTLHFDSKRSFAEADNPRFRDKSMLIVGRIAKNRIIDTIALSDNKSPALAIDWSKWNEIQGTMKVRESLEV